MKSRGKVVPKLKNERSRYLDESREEIKDETTNWDLITSKRKLEKLEDSD